MRKGGLGKKVLLSATFMVVMGSAGLAYAMSGYWSNFVSTYSTGGRIPSTSPLLATQCVLCHTGYPTTKASVSTVNSFGGDYANNGYDFAAIESLDSDGDGYTNIAEILAGTYPGDAASHPTAADTAPPTVTGFVVPATSTSLTVAITSLTATDNTGVTGYMVTATSTIPSASAAGWSATAPATYAATSAGAKTLYAWAKDGAGNVSVPVSAATTITLADTTPPTVTGFVVPATSASLTIPITSLTATDNTGVTGYMVTESPTAPLASAMGWTTTAPTSYTCASAGAKTLHAWAKDGAGNVSAGASSGVTITMSDTTPPAVEAFIVPSSSASLTVPITTLTATDNTGVTGYMVTESPTAPLASATGWTTTAPTSHTFASAGAKTLYAWAKDAAGNVSAGASSTVTIAASDATLPIVTGFTIPNASSSLTIPITALKATDDAAVTGYLVTERSTKPAANARGWKSTPPASYTFPAAGRKTLYAWAKDGAGNVSAGVSRVVVVRWSGPSPSEEGERYRETDD